MNVHTDPTSTSDAFERVLHILQTLRVECPWDRKQTYSSLRPLTIEEVYELSEAILTKDTNEMKEELGDLLLHIVFYAQIAKEENTFDIVDVINTLCNKLIRRHPHVYGDKKANNPSEVMQRWEETKLQERREKEKLSANTQKPQGVLSGVPRGLPSLIRAQRIQEKTSGVGFDWQHATDVVGKLKEEINELSEAISDKQTKERVMDEMGDVMFSMVNLTRFLGMNADETLHHANQKFIYRFEYIENYARENQIELSDLSTETMNTLWEQSKSKID